MIFFIALLMSLSSDITEDRGQKTEDRGQKTEDRGQWKVLSSTSRSCIVEVSPESPSFVLVGVPPSGIVNCSGGEVVDFIWLRRHRIARISPKGQKSEVRSQKLEVSWESVKGSLGLPEDTPFENILSRYVVNYDVAKYWVRERGQEISNVKAQNSPPEADQPPAENEIQLSGMPKYKILVREEGIYRVDYASLSQVAPEVTTIDPKTIKVLHCGFELPIVVKGEEDGRFDSDDWFEFYATRNEGKFSYLNLYSDTNVYWVSFGGLSGARLVKESCPPKNASIPDNFHSLLHFEFDSIYQLFQSFPDTLDPWFWSEFSSEHSFDLDVPLPASSGSCSLKIAFRALGGPGNCEIYLNDNLIGTASYSIGPVIFSTFFSQTMLRSSNTLKLIPSVGSLYLNFVELLYDRKYEAQGGSLKFASPGGVQPQLEACKFKINGFANPGIRVWKIGTSVICDGKIEYSDSLYNYSYTFEDTPKESTFYVAQDDILTPLAIRKIDSDLLVSTNRADYLIITNSELYDCGLTFANWKETKGFTCKVVKVQSIYDEFNFGIADPSDIRDFLQYAYEVWSLPPVYVLLLGDASYDHRDILGFNEDIVPSYEMYEQYMVSIPSDNLYACISGTDPIPDVFISRLPVKNVIEFNRCFAKLRNYEDMRLFGEWRKNLIFTSMVCAESTIAMTENIVKTYVPQEFEVKKLYYPYQGGQTELIDKINTGALFLSYIGHSGPSNWAGGLLWKDAIPSLMNVSRLPFIAVLGCQNGLFDRCGEEYVGELFIKSPGGSISYWGPSGSMYTEDKGIIEGVVSALQGNPVNTPGSLVLEGILKCFEERRNPKTILQQILMGDASTLIYTPQSGIKLNLMPCALVAGDSATITGELPTLFDGEAVITVYLSDTIQFKKLNATVSNGSFTTGFRLPDTVIEGNSKIMCYVRCDTTEFIGRQEFSIIRPNIHPYLIPDKVTSKDSVYIRAKVFDRAGVDWVRCRWGINPPPWSIIEMDLDTGGLFLTKSAIPAYPPGTNVSYKIEVKNWNGELYEYNSSYKVLTLPQLRVRSTPYLDGLEEVMLNAEIINDGEEHTDSFEVVVYAIDSLSDTILIGKDTLALSGKEYATVSMKWSLSEELDNSLICNVSVSLFNVTPSLGTDGWVSSLDSRFRCRITATSVPTVLELKDTLAGYFSRFRVKDAIINQPMEIRILPIYPNTSIYKWCPGYERWLFVNADTIAETNELGIFSLIERKDTIAPEIKINLKDIDTFYITEDSIPLKVEAVFSDVSGIDIIDRQLTIICNADTVADSLYSYPTEEMSIYALPFVWRQTFALGDYSLHFIGYDFHSNRSEKIITLHIKPVFAPETNYAWGNYPNPVRGEKTMFYFEFTDVPDEVEVCVFTIAGRLLHTFRPIPQKKTQFYWDLTVDGKICANGVYFYKVFAKKGATKITRLLKLAILR
ncbi:MAG: T9SS type A sorting domain-containing protein [Candidatus Stahlbacteria bacterium]|nr:T9SS type A sorting domain-containing protein [Candidatus Stahlbacteria bacterium]